MATGDRFLLPGPEATATAEPAATVDEAQAAKELADVLSAELLTNRSIICSVVVSVSFTPPRFPSSCGRLRKRRSKMNHPVTSRGEFLTGLSGRILEVGCGNGLNLAHYPLSSRGHGGGRDRPERDLCGQARLAARTVGPRVSVVEGRAETVSEVVTGTFDAAAFSLVLCSVADPSAVLQETKKVLKKGASVRFDEHVLSGEPGTARRQRAGAPLWSRLAGGCRPDRDTLSLIREEFLVSEVRLFDCCPGWRVPLGIVAPHLSAQGKYSE